MPADYRPLYVQIAGNRRKAILQQFIALPSAFLWRAGGISRRPPIGNRRGDPLKRVLTARFMHETNTFSRVPTDMAMIRRRDYHLENEIPEAFRGTRSAFGATFEAADKFGWSLVHPVSANPNPSGIVTDEAFETITAMVLDAVDMKGPVDGV